MNKHNEIETDLVDMLALRAAEALGFLHCRRSARGRNEEMQKTIDEDYYGANDTD